jgi:CO dehydrogenase/acetyl-CoA synthase epsilon subunit
VTDKEYEFSLKVGLAVKAKNELLTVYEYLTDEEVCELLNKLITFKNTHIVAECLKNKIAIYEELSINIKDS